MTLHCVHITHLARLDFINPTRDLRVGKDKGVLLEELHVSLDALLEAVELQELNLVDDVEGRVRGVRLLHERAQLRRVESKHSAARVVKNRDLARPKKTLRYND